MDEVWMVARYFLEEQVNMIRAGAETDTAY